MEKQIEPMWPLHSQGHHKGPQEHEQISNSNCDTSHGKKNDYESEVFLGGGGL